MQEKYLIIPRSKKLEEYTNKFNSFILPFNNYSIGYDTYFDINEINELSNSYNIYVLMNKFLHRDIDKFKSIYNEFNSNVMFIIEDIGLLDVIDKNRVILFENHIESNYKSINFLNDIGINNVVLNNDLTINELNEIRENTNSKLYFFLITRNILLYSKRKLVSNYNEYYGLKNNDNKYVITDKLTDIQLEVLEENDSSTIKYRKIYSANKYIEDLKKLDYLIIDTNSMSDLELKVTLDYYDKVELINILDVDFYFLENEIDYKVGGKAWNMNYFYQLVI